MRIRRTLLRRLDKKIKTDRIKPNPIDMEMALFFWGLKFGINAQKSFVNFRRYYRI